MSFDNNFLGQLFNKLPSLDEEIVQILTAAKEPLSVADIYKQSKVAGTSRDISLLLAKSRDLLNIEISHYATRPGFRECAHYQMIKTNTEPTADMPEIKPNEVIEMNTEVKVPLLNIVSAEKLEAFNKTEKSAEESPKLEELILQQSQNKPFALLMLMYIAENPFCTMAEINLFHQVKHLGESYIPGYIERGEVLVTKDLNGHKIYQLAPGLKVSDIYKGKLNKKPKVKAEQSSEAKENCVESTQNNVSEGLKLVFDLPETKIHPELTAPISGVVKSAPQSGAFRCAYTNDGCLLLLGIQVLPIELNAAQTNDLINYISETVTPIGVAI